MPNPNTQSKGGNDIVSQVAERVRTSDNVLIALSKDPSVDELSAALGLTFILDRMGKHATAIFSGAVPNAIEFLEPEKTFETNTNSLQDFIIALDKEKADHLRYKIDGDYVKVFITPYKTTINESDMEFSHGDYNVDLVVALNVASSNDLDSALTEYGRIMHDASSINISANVPGKFGDLEWGDPAASSVSEMVYRLSEAIKEKDKDNIDKSTATALLAGIVSATNRFSNERTSPETMSIASKLMSAGADQQLISSSIPVDILTADVVDATDDAKEETKDDLSDIIGDSRQESEEPSKPEQPSESDSKLESDSEPEQKDDDEMPSDPTNLEVHHATNVEGENGDDAEEVSVDSDTLSADEKDNDSEPNSDAPAAADPSRDGEAEQPAPEPESTPEPKVEPKPAPKPEEAASNEPRQMQGPNIKPVEPPVAPIAPAVPEPQIELSVDKLDMAKKEQADATEKLEKLVAPVASSDTKNSVLNELQDPNVHTKKNLVPPSEALAPPKVPKDYAAMMASELSDEPIPKPEPGVVSESEPLIAPVPEKMPMLDTSPEPTENKKNQTGTVDNEYVDPPLPMPDANTVLPPPPLPFDPAAAPKSVEDAPAAAPFGVQSAQEFVEHLKGGNADSKTPKANDAPTSNAQISMPPVVEPAHEEKQPEPADSGPKGGVMQDQVYPADPGAFHIPGM